MGLFGVTNEQLKELRTRYPEGTIIQLDYMADEQAPPYGTKGIVENVDDAGTIHVHWENGCGLGLLPFEGDKCHVVSKQIVACNIEYDCEKAELEYLPKEIVIPTGIQGDEEIANYISDKTGYCIKSFCLSNEMEYNTNSFIVQIKKEITVDTFENIKNISKYKYTEGEVVGSVRTYNSTSVPMIIDIAESDSLYEDGATKYLESWCYFLVDGGNINNIFDYEHYDGGKIVSYNKLQKMDYDSFIKVIHDNANEYLASYLKQKETKDISDDFDEIEI